MAWGEFLSYAGRSCLCFLYVLYCVCSHARHVAVSTARFYILLKLFIWRAWNGLKQRSLNILAIIIKECISVKRSTKKEFKFLLHSSQLFHRFYTNSAPQFPLFSCRLCASYIFDFFSFVSNVSYNNRALFKIIMPFLSAWQALLLFTSLFSSDKRLLNPFCPTACGVLAASHCSFWSVDPLSRFRVDQSLCRRHFRYVK